MKGSMVTMAFLAMVELARGATGGEPAKLAEAFVELLAAGRFAEAATGFDAAMSGAMPAPKLEATWKTLQAQVGAYRSHGAATVVPQGELRIAVVPLTFEKAALLAKVVYAATGQVTGLFFAPADAPPAAQPPPGREKAGSFVERAVSVGAAGWPLAGVLALPPAKGPHPAVVLVHGSGPHDADETVGGTKVFRDLAQGLAARGVAALRYEKRSKAHGLRMVAQPFTVKEEIVDDAVAAVAFLRTVPEVDPQRIFVLGHSLGGAMLPRIARLDASIAGLISLAGSTKSIELAVVQQTWYILEHSGASAEEKHRAMMEANAFAQAVQDPQLAKRDPKQLLMGCPPAYWLDLRGYRAPLAAEKLPQRMLLLQGERDYQVKVSEDFAFWKAQLGKRKDVTFKTYPKLNHLFVAGEGDSVPAEYAKPGHVALEVVEDIARWVR